MQKVEADHNQINFPTNFSSDLLNLPQKRETTAKEPYRRHPKVDTFSIHDEDFLKNYSLGKLHELALEKKFSGRQDKEVEESITTISQTYFDSEAYQQSLNLLFSTIKSVEPDKTKLEKSYKRGLIRNLRVFYRVTKGVPDSEREEIIPEVINEFESHCQHAAQKFVTDRRYKHLRPTFHVLIQYPDLHHLEILDQIVPQINKGSFLTYFVVNHLFKSRYEDTALKEAIVKKTEVFERLKIDNEEHQLGASISDLRIATVFYANPVAFLEKTAEKRQQRVHSRKKTNHKEAKITATVKSAKDGKDYDKSQKQANTDPYNDQDYPNNIEDSDQSLLLESLTQKYKDVNIFGLKQIIVESIRRRRQDASMSIDKYIAIMSSENFSTKYGGIPKSTIYAVISKYIYKKNVDLSAMYRELKREALQW
jgi:hypothetical protein